MIQGPRFGATLLGCEHYMNAYDFQIFVFVYISCLFTSCCSFQHFKFLLAPNLRRIPCILF